jgi:hypothetical protein
MLAEVNANEAPKPDQSSYVGGIWISIFSVGGSGVRDRLFETTA